MDLIIKKTREITGEVLIPSSKSQSIRAIFLALIADGKSILKNILLSDDTLTAIRTCEAMGAKIYLLGNQLVIESKGLPLKPRDKIINTGNSGIATHFVIPLLGLRQDSEQLILLDCDEQMKTRPIFNFLNSLKNFGLKIKHLNNSIHFPICVSGTLIGGKWKC